MIEKYRRICIALFLAIMLMPLTTVFTTGSVVGTAFLGSGVQGKTIFIGKHTFFSRFSELASDNVVGWLIQDGHLRRYRGSLPLDTKDFRGFIGKAFFIIVFDNNPFQ